MTLQELFAKPGVWIQHEMAKDAEGRYVPATSSRACCFCLFGGIEHCYADSTSRSEARRKLREAINRKHGYPEDYPTRLIDYNDDPRMTQEAILEICKEADV